MMDGSTITPQTTTSSPRVASLEAGDFEQQQPIVYINGKRYVLPLGSAEKTLLQYLRSKYLVPSSKQKHRHLIHIHRFLQVLALLELN